MSAACTAMLSGAALVFLAIGNAALKAIAMNEKLGLSYRHLSYVVGSGGSIMIMGGLAI